MNQKKPTKPQTRVIKGSNQLSNAKLKEIVRLYTPSALNRLIELTNSNNENVALGAVKVLLNKIMPDIKAVELSHDERKELVVRIIGFNDQRIEDAQEVKSNKPKLKPSKQAE